MLRLLCKNLLGSQKSLHNGEVVLNLENKYTLSTTDTECTERLQIDPQTDLEIKQPGSTNAKRLFGKSLIS